MPNLLVIDDAGIRFRNMDAVDKAIMLFPRDPAGAIVHLVSDRVDMTVKFQRWGKEAA